MMDVAEFVFLQQDPYVIFRKILGDESMLQTKEHNDFLELGACGERMQTSTARGFEPLRAEPNGFPVHLLSSPDTLS